MFEKYKTKIRIVNKQYTKAKKEIRFAYTRVNNIIKLSKTPYYSRLLKLTRSVKPLKRSMSGFELEYALIDNQGTISNNSHELIQKIRKLHPEANAVKEIGKHMLEFHSFPSVKVQDTSLNLIQNAIKITEAAERAGIMLYPFACYPGKFDVQLHDDPRYAIQEKIIGRERYLANAPSVYGFHFHYTMPRGVFDYKNLFLRDLVRSKIKHSFIESYNMLIAADPALITFMQSSPYVNNKYLANDSRVLLIRGGRKLGYMDGWFAKNQMLGALPPYKHTIYDLNISLKQKDRKWKELMARYDLKSQLVKEKLTLDCIWNPVKINKLGTFEQRGMDTNLLSYVIATGTLIRVVLRAIQNDRLVVWPSDIGMSEPFKIEGNLVYIPPHSYVRNKLQRYAAYEGIKNKEIYSYCSKYFKFAKKLVNRKYHQLLRPIENIIEDRKTMSDIILAKAKKAGYGINDALTDEFVREFALDSADEFKKDLFKTEEVICKI
ncbi:TPA: hypothetical protein HA246_07510 [Candidatus Woesearchaeota archaeon]|nr:hypothetical protein [Candidatus Woesearchaeota archaeon]